LNHPPKHNKTQKHKNTKTKTQNNKQKQKTNKTVLAHNDLSHVERFAMLHARMMDHDVVFDLHRSYMLELQAEQTQS